MKRKAKWLIGIDEAGRGPLAGPVAVGAVLILSKFDYSCFSLVRDSKQLSAKQRERVFLEMNELRKKGRLNFMVSMTSVKVIDRSGINKAVALGIKRSLTRLHADAHTTHVLLDGLLKAPDRFLSQETIIRGDQTEPVISLASIAAKVMRDRYMIKMSRLYPNYGFERHKGYGTKVHRRMIQKHRPCKIHRLTFRHS